MLESFFIFGKVPLNAEYGIYAPFLVALSYTVAVLASYTALNFAGYLVYAKKQGDNRKCVHMAGAFAMGAGIWAMHFIGMLSYKMQMMVEYSPLITIFSMVVAVVIAYFVLHIVKTSPLTIPKVLLGAVLLGIGISAMHYTGMAAMQMDATLRYTPGWFAISVGIAIAASAAALLIIFYLIRFENKYQIPLKIVAAMVMGAAICGMHYSGMKAAVMVPFADCRYDSNQNVQGLVSLITVTIFIMLGTSIFFTTASQKSFWLADKAKKMIYQHTISLVVVMAVAFGVLCFIQIRKIETNLIESVAVEDAANLSKMLEAFRSIYTAEVVQKAKKAGMEITHDYKHKKNAIPLPATLSKMLGKELSHSLEGGSTRLYSPYSFPWRKNGGIKTQFEQDAWNELVKHPDSTFYRIEEENGRQYIQYAVADIMRPQCVGCHNSHPQSPKTDWKPGDVRGVLKVKMPLSDSFLITHKSTSNLLWIMMTCTMIGIVLIILIIASIKKREKETQYAQGKLLKEFKEKALLNERLKE